MSADRPWAGRRLHFVGIGGAGMSGLAVVSSALGASVSGSDRAESPYLERVREVGISPVIGHAAENVPADAEPDGAVAGPLEIVVSTAISGENPELVEGRSRGLRELHRGQLLGEVSALRRCIAVTGTHGKSTTSAMVVRILREAGLDPSYLVGASLTETGTNAEWGGGDWVVVEADESDRSLLHLHPEIAVVTNLELDHHSTYSSRLDLEATMREFLAGAGRAVVLDEPSLLALSDGPVVAFGVSDVSLDALGSRFVWRMGVEGGSWRVSTAGIEGGSGTGIEGESEGGGVTGIEGGLGTGAEGEPEGGGVTGIEGGFGTGIEGESGPGGGVTGIRGGSGMGVEGESGAAGVSVRLPVPGLHNALNAAAALTAAALAGVDPVVGAAGLAGFRPAGRRFERVGETSSGAVVVDDYAHHPTEVAATLAAARTLGPARLVAVFQPHLYSRTAALWREFGAALAGADLAVVLEIYRAREDPADWPGISGRLVAAAAADASAGGPVAWLPGQPEAEAFLRTQLRPGDLLVTLGAGDVDALAHRLVA